MYPPTSPEAKIILYPEREVKTSVKRHKLPKVDTKDPAELPEKNFT